MGPYLVGLAGDQLHLQLRESKRSLGDISRESIISQRTADGVNIFPRSLFGNTDPVCTLILLQIALQRKSGMSCRKCPHAYRPVEFAQVSAAYQLAQSLAARQRFAAQHQAAGIAVQTITYGGTEQLKVFDARGAYPLPLPAESVSPQAC